MRSGIHPGPDYGAWQAAHGGQAPFAVLYADNDYEGQGWVLAGGLLDLDEAGIEGISSVRICPPILRATVDQDVLGVIDLNDPARDEFQTVDATIAPVPLVVKLFVDAQFQGYRIVVVESGGVAFCHDKAC